MFFETKKGKYTEEENELIIKTMNEGLKEGKKEREILKELSEQLKRGYSGVMSHVRKLRSEYPDRFHSLENSPDGGNRLNSWEKEEEELVIDTVNEYLEEGKSLSAAISELEKKLSRTQGAIYQRIYTLRRKHPEKFKHLPVQRPRRRRQLHDWPFHPSLQQVNQSFPVPSKDLSGTNRQLTTAFHQMHTYQQSLLTPSDDRTDHALSMTPEEELVLKAFEKKYGRPNNEAKSKLLSLMRTYGTTRVSVAMFTLTEDKAFPSHIIEFLEKHLINHKFL